MRGVRILFVVMAALAVGACMRQPAQTYYIIDPQTGQPVPVITQQQQFTQPQYAQQPMVQQPMAPQGGSHGLYSTSPAYAQQAYGPAQYAQPAYPPATTPRRAAGSGRGFFTSQRSAPVYAQPQVRPQVQQPYVAQYAPPAAARAYAAAPANYQPDYTLDSGDK
ncbi:MAG: hypothetical protein Q7V40_06280, partial [Pseudolabrys sp.]|nr:hypothetical protein [Pseudolabrys sp.]